MSVPVLGWESCRVMRKQLSPHWCQGRQLWGTGQCLLFILMEISSTYGYCQIDQVPWNIFLVVFGIRILVKSFCIVWLFDTFGFPNINLFMKNPKLSSIFWFSKWVHNPLLQSLGFIFLRMPQCRCVTLRMIHCKLDGRKYIQVPQTLFLQSW